MVCAQEPKITDLILPGFSFQNQTSRIQILKLMLHYGDMILTGLKLAKPGVEKENFMKYIVFILGVFYSVTLHAGFPGTYSLDFEATKTAYEEAVQPNSEDSQTLKDQKADSYGMIDRFASATMKFVFQEDGVLQFEMSRDRVLSGSGTWTRQGDVVHIVAEALGPSTSDTTFTINGDSLQMKLGSQFWFLVFARQE